MKRNQRKAEPQSYRLNRLGCQAANPYLVKSLDISTGHLTQLDSVRLGNANCRVNDGNPITVYKYEEGYFVHISEEETDYLAIAEYEYSPQFIAILRRAKELGCKYVQFDCDGIPYDDLETYEW